MATKKPVAKKIVRAPRTKLTPEQALEKSVNTILTSAAGTKGKIIEGVDSVTGLLLEKQSELGELINLIADKKEELDTLVADKTLELEELAEKEEILKDLADLEIELEEKQAAQKRALDALRIVKEDELIALKRQHQLAAQAEKERLADAQRALRIALEDEARGKDLAFKVREEAIAEQEVEIASMKEEIAGLEGKVKAQVGKETGIIKAQMESDKKLALVQKEAEITILNGKVGQQIEEITSLKQRLAASERAAEESARRLAAIATSALDKESGAAALKELRDVAHKQAEGKK
jgi:hypothetical protein